VLLNTRLEISNRVFIGEKRAIDLPGDDMFCPLCGAESTQGLKYCKRCGASLSAPVDSTPRKFPTALTTVFLLLIGGITLFGFGTPLAAASTLTKDFSTGDVMALVFGSWVVTLLFDAMLIWLLLRLMKVSDQFAPTTQAQQAFPEERIRAQIDKPNEPLGSVTEHTTRNFEPSRYRQSEARAEEH
jgi:hypothetical protein